MSETHKSLHLSITFYGNVSNTIDLHIHIPPLNQQEENNSGGTGCDSTVSTTFDIGNVRTVHDINDIYFGDTPTKTPFYITTTPNNINSTTNTKMLETVNETNLP